LDSQIIVLTLVTFLHDLFTAIWIGGLITIGITTLPSARQILGKSPQTKQLMEAVQKRHSPLVYISIVGLAVTDMLLSRRAPEFGGLLSFANAYSSWLSVKHILVAIMVAVALLRSLGVGRKGAALSPVEEKKSALLLFVNVFLGIAVLLVSALLAALASSPL
jgi:putative copper export protein